VEEDSILVHQAGSVGVIKVEGRGSFRTARLVKIFGEKADSLGISEIIYDLRNCTYMDSTFMGVMAGLGAAQRKNSGVPLAVYHTSPRNLELLENLGLNHLLDLKKGEIPISPTSTETVGLDTSAGSKEEISEIMLDAHETLIELNPANAAQFKDVVTFLRERLGLTIA
jgi:anti-anti-sigma factor